MLTLWQPNIVTAEHADAHLPCCSKISLSKHRLHSVLFATLWLYITMIMLYASNTLFTAHVDIARSTFIPASSIHSMSNLNIVTQLSIHSILVPPD